ncbi:MFS transporter [Thalassotalea agarivorans]|uniref:Predicted arabinose efflux permease, MFS family n=1 Tax=Thalassotalea agarivorans TaxID=349064 RepID=A0A1I0H5S4_THASX|nr:MFS transporter [Thalassotalea agarivorans]SET79075.1 Predicted arabinose efflux permease, MFS family [Thalassotalea agarivorans]
MPFRFARTPENMLLAMAFIMPLVFSVWMVLLNNFVVERAAFTGKEIGILQSLREIPGFLAFTVIYLLLFIKEQRLALLSLGVTCFGVMITGFYPTALGLYITTIIMSAGFHYFETVNQSLTLQWIKKEDTAHFLGRALSAKSIASLLAFSSIWLLMEYFQWDYQNTYLLFGAIGLLATIILAASFPRFEQKEEQHKKIILRKRYWLFYSLTFFSGARRQIFVVFAGFLMVEKFGYSVAEVSALFLINYVFNWLFAAKIGKLIGIIGERRTLIFEYIGLAILFVSYGLVESGTWAAVLYVIDHLLFALAIAIKTYFQKIADPKDIAASAGVSFTINHIAAVFIPALLGLVWVYDNSLVFFVGAGFAVCSLLLSTLVPMQPSQDNITRLTRAEVN